MPKFYGFCRFGHPVTKDYCHMFTSNVWAVCRQCNGMVAMFDTYEKAERAIRRRA